jgi:hypothetical protein
MATKEDVVNVINKFHTNFPNDAFLAFDSKSSINFLGSILLDYKGLRIIKFKKAQLMNN